MITCLDIQSFKGWRDTKEIRLAPVTGLFGTNSSGKTSILQLLLMLKQTADSADRGIALEFGDDKTLVSLGTLQSVLFDHDASEALRWDIVWQLESELRVTDPQVARGPVFRSSQLEFQGSVSLGPRGRPTTDYVTYRFDGHDFRLGLDASRRHYELTVAPADSFTFRRPPGRPIRLSGPAKCYGFPDEVRAYFQNADFLADFELEFEKLMASIYYLGPLREDPKRQYIWGGAQPQDVGQRGERVVDAMLAARARNQKVRLGHRRLAHLETYVAEWLRRLELISSFRVVPVSEGSNLYQVLVRRSVTTAEVLLTDVGFGISQILPVIVLCFYVPEGSVVILEQPEIHLHPAVQAGLADVLIDAIKLRRIQVLVESHSEHLLQRLQRRIAEEQLDAENVALYFCEPVGDHNRLTPLRVNKLGFISNWPQGFFGQPLEETVAMTRAAQSRLKAVD
jgi:predicted ATPase